MPPAAHRPRMLVALLLALSLLLPGSAWTQTVSVQAGDVVYLASAQAAPRRLTSSGLDREPRLSPDGRTVAFIRGTPGDQVETALGQEEAASLWIVRTDGSRARMLVRGRANDDPRRTLAALQAPWFSPDGRRIYFLSAGWATSGGVHVVDVATGSERFVAPGNSLEVVPAGRYAGYLLVSQHRYRPQGGSYDWTWLLTPDGREVTVAGEDEASLTEFRARYVDP